MLSILLLGAAFAADDPGLPPAPSTRPAPPVYGSAGWLGVSAPMFSHAVGSGSLLAVSADVDWCMATNRTWFQPELRIGGAQGFSVLGDPPAVGPDTTVYATFGARFGREQGVYGGLGTGSRFTWTQADEGGTLHSSIEAFGFVGYAFSVGDRVRLSPELTVGTLNTLSVRIEWGGKTPVFEGG